MTTSSRDTVIGVFRDQERAREAIEALKQADFRAEEISVLMPGQDEAEAIARETGANAQGAGAATGLVAGGILGGVAGWLAGIGTMTIPGVGPFIGAGVLGSTLSGATLGAGIGAVGGALVNMGVPEHEARWYERQAHGGRTLVVVHGALRSAEAWSILHRHGAYDVETPGASAAG